MSVLYNVCVDTSGRAAGASPIAATMFRHIDDRALRAGDRLDREGHVYIVVRDASVEPSGRCGAVVVRPAE